MPQCDLRKNGSSFNLRHNYLRIPARFVILIVMKKLTISNAERVILTLEDEIQRSPESRYEHRLHAILLIVRGNSSLEAAQLLGDAPRTIANWVKRFEQRGLAGLMERGRSGRPRRLSEDQVAQIDAALRKTPRDFGLTGNVWSGKTLAAFIRQWNVTLGVRQCQRMLRKRQ